MLFVTVPQHVISCSVAYSCSERYFKDTLHWEEELMLLQVDRLHTSSCIILCRFPEDAVCFTLLCLWLYLHVRAEWGDSACPALPPRELVLAERAGSVSWAARRRLARRHTWMGKESAWHGLPLCFPSLYWRVQMGEVGFSLMWIWLSNSIKKPAASIVFYWFWSK